jgi:hypothetical protein
MKLAFLHIPKTGGISVEDAIAGSFPELSVCPTYFPADWLGKTFAEVGGYDVYKGHFDMDFAATLPEDYVKAVVVRKPADLLVSLFNHVATRPNHRMHETAAGTPETFPTLLAEKSFHNILAKYLIGRRTYKEITTSAGSRRQKIDRAVDATRRSLDTFDVIGVTPRLGDFVNRLAERLDASIKAPGWKNKSPAALVDGKALTAEQTAAIERATWLDRPIFTMAAREYIPKSSPRP